MTDWVVAMITRSPGKVEEDKRWEVAKNRVCRNDSLGSGLVKEGGRRKQGREKKLQKAVGRKDPLSPSVGEEVGKW